MKTNIKILFEKYGLTSESALIYAIEELIKEKTATQETWLGRMSIEHGGKWYSNTEDRVKELGERILNEPFNPETQQQQHTQDMSKITRVEVIDHSAENMAKGQGARAYVKCNAKSVELSYQDDGRTLKMFVK